MQAERGRVLGGEAQGRGGRGGNLGLAETREKDRGRKWALKVIGGGGAGQIAGAGHRWN